MPLWLASLLDVLLLVVVLVLLAMVGILARRRTLARAGPTFDMAVNRRAEHTGAGWTLGLGVYRQSELHWYRTFSLSLRPRYRFARSDLLITGRRTPVGREGHALQVGHLIVDTDNAQGVKQFALSMNALTGLLSWLESSPPGERVNNVI